jgi:hypothetical protein
VLELVAGLIVAMAALALVLEPLARAAVQPAAAGPVGPDESDLVEVRESESPKVQALIALREIEFDRATGKLSEDDYLSLKAKYEAAALAAIQAEERSPRPLVTGQAPEHPSPPPEAGHAMCPACGPRPEAAPVFCSSCGRSLVAQGRGPRCWHCGAGLPDDARFCAECGGAVGAGV